MISKKQLQKFLKSGKLRLVAVYLVYFAAGLVTCRAGQKIVTQRYYDCVSTKIEDAAEDGSINMDDLLQIQEECWPNVVVRKLFFW